MDMPNMPKEIDRILFRPDLQLLMRVNTETIRRWMVSGKLPKPDIAFSRKVVGWRLSTLKEHGISIP